jgi:hypothetical protein
MQEYPVCAVMPFSDRRGHGMAHYPELRAWAKAFFQSIPERPSRFDYWRGTDSSLEDVLRQKLQQNVEMYVLTAEERAYLLDRLGKTEPPPDPEPEPGEAEYRDHGAYLHRRWEELEIPRKTREIAERRNLEPWERVQLKTMATLRKVGSDPRLMGLTRSADEMRRLEDLEAEFTALQTGALIQVTKELHHDQGAKDVGLSGKPSGHSVTMQDGRKVAEDIVTVKPTVKGKVVPGNWMLVDAISAGGSADAKPAWNVLGPNTDSSRTWEEPPRSGA